MYDQKGDYGNILAVVYPMALSVHCSHFRRLKNTDCLKSPWKNLIYMDLGENGRGIVLHLMKIFDLLLLS